MRVIRNFFISLLAFIYLILEYIFWDTILQPIYLKFKELQLYKSFLVWISQQNKYFILIIFILFFGISEVMGVLALAVLAQGMIGLFIFIYIVKFIPVAVAFTVLENSKESLLTISWFAFSYHLTMKVIHIIKTNQLFLQSKAFLDKIKNRLAVIVSFFRKEQKTKVGLFRRLLSYIIKKNR